MKNCAQECLTFIQKHPGSFQVVRGQKEMLEKAGYEALSEHENWTLKAGGKYYLTRNSSSLIAFRIPEKPFNGFMIMASHSDSPSLRIKPHPEIKKGGNYTVLNVEGYGGAILSTWMDRPLSVAGRIYVRCGNGVSEKLINIDRDLMVIPSLAIHMNRKVNEGMALNIQKDLLPIYGDGSSENFMALIAKEAGVKEKDILSHELMLYARSAPAIWGEKGMFMSSPRLDNSQCAFASLKGFLNAAFGSSIPVHVVFDNEEVGSGTRQGAASTFLKDTLRRIVFALGGDEIEYDRYIAQSMMLSADNAHGLHPNYTEKSDETDHPVLGGGVVLKHAANQKYTTDALSEALCHLLAEKTGITLQDFVNRSDSPGGSTLGNISVTQVPVITADIGIAQLAMHSAYETASVRDTIDLVKLAETFFASSLKKTEEGQYLLD